MNKPQKSRNSEPNEQSPRNIFEIFSCFWAPENSSHSRGLRTDISPKTVVGCPWPAVLQLGEDDFNTHVSLEAIRHSYHNLHFQFNKMDSRAAENEFKKLNTHKATGWNVISNKILKPIAVSLARSLTKLFNTCIQSGKRPSTWKRGVWIPVFKKKDRADFNLHRRKMSTHALEKMTRDLFRAMSWAPRQKCTGNVTKMLLR